MSDNYVLSGLWLVGTLGGILYGGYHATIHAKDHAQVAEKSTVKAEMLEAIKAANYGRYAEAARGFEALQKRHPNSNSIALNLGIAYSALEMYGDAKTQFDAVLSRNPKDWDAVAELAVLEVLQGREPAGLTLLEKIPEGQGQLEKRLVADPVWLRAKDQKRIEALRDKHGVVGFGDTSARRLMEMERRRKEFEAANPKRPANKPAETTTP